MNTMGMLRTKMKFSKLTWNKWRSVCSTFKQCYGMKTCCGPTMWQTWCLSRLPLQSNKPLVEHRLFWKLSDSRCSQWDFLQSLVTSSKSHPLCVHHTIIHVAADWVSVIWKNMCSKFVYSCILCLLHLVNECKFLSSRVINYWTH
jgi:hypothetical protein